MAAFYTWFDIIAGFVTEQNIRIVTTYATFFLVAWNLAKTLRNNQKITIIAVNDRSGESLAVARIPRFQVTRSEVLGIMRLQAGGNQLDTSCFKWNDKIPRKARFHFPPSSFALLTGQKVAVNA
ncbi:hypothetical protein Rvan_1884 [Rhodomicrobium vannielii ATCC 17100]|uniref:Uncharacterized protein n=1 Tax=Rhodomicrobium vannielii (strain ATCC 17100 / DSM 162 / LMG 4299 / NCIMB 10020 / ATH 3.1.1) TaxID=648757 RepID=E3I088_RHOVT|nr:hypothetical protein [Rhodomicrobium vannielii]ADP71123.1 hypothetical protein Rvan_1884 [Rhodomicrobium vannielii ATCC 17100]